MKNVWWVFAVTFLMTSAVSAQVHIKEAVGISPESPKRTNDVSPCNTSANLPLHFKSTVTVTILYVNDDYCYPNTDIGLIITSPTFQTIIPNALTPGATWTSPEYDAGTGINFGMIEHHKNGCVDTAYGASIVNLPGDEYNTAWGIMGAAGNSENCEYTTGIGAWVYFNVLVNPIERLDHVDVIVTPDTVNASDSASVTVIAKDSSGKEIHIPDCAGVDIGIPPSWGWLGQQIANGNYGVMACDDAADGPMGPRGFQIWTNYGAARAGRIRYVATGSQIWTGPVITLNASVGFFENGGSGSTTLKVIPTPVDHFYVHAEPDTIPHNGSATIHIQAKDKDGNDITISGDTLLSITPDDNGEYGEIYDWSDGTTDQPHPYGDAWGGSIGYVAIGKDVDTVQKVAIKVAEVNNPSISGTGEVFIDPLDHFVVSPVPDTIPHSDTGSNVIYVQAKDKQNKDIDYPGDILISASPAGYGDLGNSWSPAPGDIEKIKVPNQVVKLGATRIGKSMVMVPQTKSSTAPQAQPVGKDVATTDQLQVWYSPVANEGYLYYAPDGIVPDSMTTITLAVSAVDKPSATGKGSLVIIGGGPNLKFQRYSQGDSQWKDSTYDNDIKLNADNSGDSVDADGDTVYCTIGNAGCALTDMAWLLTAYGYKITPEELNEWMNSKAYNYGGYDGSKVNWNAIHILSAGNLDVFSHPDKPFGGQGNSNAPNVLDGYLADGDQVFAQVKDEKGEQHWVVVKAEGYAIMDPGFLCTSLNDNYGKFWSYVVVSRAKRK